MIIVPQHERLRKGLIFDQFQKYAAFILKKHLKEFAKTEIEYSREENVPLLKLLAHLNENELFDLALDSAKDFLTFLARNEAQKYIEKSVFDYKQNLLPIFAREAVLAEDITLISLVRRRAFRKFLYFFTQDIVLFGKIMEELDRFIALHEKCSFNAFIEIQEEKIKQVNQDLYQKNEDLLKAEELAEMGSFVWDMNNNLLKSTPGIFKILQPKKPGHLTSFLENVHEEDKERVLAAVNQSFSNNGIYESEYRYFLNGEIKNIWTRGQVFFDEEGKPEYMKGTIMDVTRRHLILQLLQESEAINKHVQAITHIGNWSWDIGSDKISWSDEMYRIYGLEPKSEEISLNRFLSFLHPEDRHQREKEIQQSIDTGIATDYEMRIINPDGTIKVLRGKGEVIKDLKNKPIKLIGSCQDITKEDNLIKEVEEKKNYLSQLIINAPDGIIVFDKLGIITLWNPKSEEILGFQEQDVLGKPLSEIIFPKQYQLLYNRVLQDLVYERSTEFLNKDLELTAINSKEKELYVSCRISHFHDNKLSPFIVFLKDITVQKQTKEELKAKTSLLEKLNDSLAKKNIELEYVNRELNSFNHVASHDLQEPLRKIQIFTTRILEKNGSALPVSTKEYLDKIKVSSDRMKLLIEDLLTFSQASVSENSFQAVDLNITVEDVIQELSFSIEERNAGIEHFGLPEISGIPFQIQQLFSNLLSNAIKYCDGEVTPCIEISAKLENGGSLPFNEANPEKHYHQVIIKDNGIGFEPDYSEKIFGLFQRLHGKNHYSGTGIGLAICKKIMHNHNGFIKAESTPGKGSIFNLYFPI